MSTEVETKPAAAVAAAAPKGKACMWKHLGTFFDVASFTFHIAALCTTWTHLSIDATASSLETVYDVGLVNTSMCQKTNGANYIWACTTIPNSTMRGVLGWARDASSTSLAFLLAAVFFDALVFISATGAPATILGKSTAWLQSRKGGIFSRAATCVCALISFAVFGGMWNTNVPENFPLNLSGATLAWWAGFGLTIAAFGMSFFSALMAYLGCGTKKEAPAAAAAETGAAAPSTEAAADESTKA